MTNNGPKNSNHLGTDSFVCYFKVLLGALNMILTLRVVLLVNPHKGAVNGVCPASFHKIFYYRL